MITLYNIIMLPFIIVTCTNDLLRAYSYNIVVYMYPIKRIMRIVDDKIQKGRINEYE